MGSTGGTVGSAGGGVGSTGAGGGSAIWAEAMEPKDPALSSTKAIAQNTAVLDSTRAMSTRVSRRRG